MRWWRSGRCICFRKIKESFLRKQESISKMKSKNNYYVYILASKKNGTLYIGVTNNLERRIYEHKNGLVKGFTKKYKVHLLVYYEHFDHIQYAIIKEKQMKKWKRQWKINLIEEHNPEWKDLSKEWEE